MLDLFLDMFGYVAAGCKMLHKCRVHHWLLTVSWLFEAKPVVYLVILDAQIDEEFQLAPIHLGKL